MSYRKVLVRALGRERAFAVDYKLGRVRAAIAGHSRTIDRPIFLWGAGRTGSYLLYDILSMHPDVVCPRAPTRLNDGLYGSHHHGKGEWDHILDNPFPPIEGARRLFGQFFPDIAWTSEYSEEQLSQLQKNFAILGGSSWSRKRVLDKAPHYTFLLPVLETMFPDALHVHCVRHPIAVARSYHRRMTEPDARGSDGTWGLVHPDDWARVQQYPLIDQAAWLAVNAMKQALKNEERLGDRCLRVDYQETTDQPREIAQRVMQFCQLTPDPNLIVKLPERFKNYNKKGADLQLRYSELQTELESLCVALGYSDESSPQVS